MSAPGRSPRHLGLTTLVALVVANMIGAGVFTTSGFALQDLGTPARVMLAWVVGGVVAVLGALCYGALARRLQESGGEYLFLARTLHPAAGFVAGWVSLWAGFTGAIALAAEGLQAYVAPLLPPGVPPDLLGSVVIVLAGALHASGRRHGPWLHNIAVVVKVALLVAFLLLGAAGLPSLPPEAAPGPLPLGAFAVTLMWVSLSYSGWNAAVYVAGEARAPERTLPRSLWLGTALVTALYLGLNLVFLHAAPASDLAGRADVAAVAAAALGGPGLEGLVRAVVALALWTSISGMVLTGPRVYAQMATDGVFPAWLAPGDGGPARAVWLQVVLAVAVLWLSGLQELLGYLGFTLSLCTALSVVGLLRLRRREGAVAVPIPGHPVVPILFVVLVLVQGVTFLIVRPREPLVGLGTVATGLLFYVVSTALGRRGSGPA